MDLAQVEGHGRRLEQRWRWWWRGARLLAAVGLIVGATLVSPTTAQDAGHQVRHFPSDSQSAPASAMTAGSHDIIVTGGIDGRVYAINAWTGDVLWMFDSGGPMVDSSYCGAAQPTPKPEPSRPSARHNVSPPPPEPWRTTTLNVNGDYPAAPSTEDASIVATARTSRSSVLTEMVPSYDGRLYHISGGQHIRELDMTMVDIINSNGPVRLMQPVADAESPSASSLSDILLVGEKHTRMFALDAIRGRVQPFLSAATKPGTQHDILFGRAEYKTKAIDVRNASAARCFSIGEYFLEFAEPKKCPQRTGPTPRPPDILVVPKDPDTSVAEDEESVLAAYDPWTHEQLWELQIPQFDVVAVFGVSANRASTFYQWSIDGPSSTASRARHSAKAISMTTPKHTSQQLMGGTSSEHASSGIEASAIQSAVLDQVKTIERDWKSLESQFRFRTVDGNYFLAPSDDSLEFDRGGSGASYFDPDDHIDQDHLYHHRQLPKRRRRVFWESIENDGKRGVFITYYHVGAMMLGVTVGCVLIAWGCYVKGLSASLAHTAQALDNQFLSHIHQLTIERPGQEKITISSVVSRPLLMNSAANAISLPMQRTMGIIDGRQVPLLENDSTDVPNGATVTKDIPLPQHSMPMDPDTEAAIMKKFSALAALEAASLLTGAKLPTNGMEGVAFDASISTTESTSLTSSSTPSNSLSTLSSSASTLTLTGSGASTVSLTSDLFSSHRRSLLLKSDSDSSTPKTTEDADGRVVPVVEMLDDSSGSESCASSSPVVDECSEGGSQGKSILWSSSNSVRGNCLDRDDSSGSASDSEATSSNSNPFGGSNSSGSQSDQAVLRKASDASSSSSTPNEAEVLFPFVCQSRFSNEFVELSALGKGGFGQVVLAENRLDGRKYAIKRVGLHLKNQTSKTLQKFLREVKILALLDHPNIVRYYQAWLEKIDEGENKLQGDIEPSVSSLPPRNYSMSNLLAPISEMEFSGHQRSFQHYGDVGFYDDDDVGFEWERNSNDGFEDDQGWREEDMAAGRVNATKERIRGKSASNGESASESTITRGHKPKRAVNEDSSCYSVDHCDHWLYIQMQYCAGRNLGDYLALPNRPMELAKLLKIFSQIASAIAHVHSCGLIHRDLKPANIFVADTDGDSIKLGDFGLSRYAANVNLTTQSVEEYTSTTNMLMNGHLVSSSKWSVSNYSESQDITAGVGTYLYASPEQVAGKKYNAKTDMYSLGMILFELCHERFGTTMERYMTLRSARDRSFPESFMWRSKCPELMDMLEKLLDPDPMGRPDASDVVIWSQDLFEATLLHSATATMKRSPVHHGRSFTGNLPTLNIADITQSTTLNTFSLQVEAGTDSGNEENGERRLPNHNLLKEICDIIADVSGGRMEIKKCGLHLQDGGGQVLDFVLDPHYSKDEATKSQSNGFPIRRSLMKAIEALPDVSRVHMGV